MDKLRIKISAIAKDEAAYIPDWVHHHLFFGFDHIEIIINRTTDNSNEVLKKITSTNKNVSFLSFDWLDLCPDIVQRQIQYVAYADAYNRAINEGFTHLLLIDIDEYWTPIDFSTSIKDFINNYPQESSFSFNWLCELGIEEEFSCLQKNFKFFSNDHVKTLINLSANVEKIKIHAPIFSTQSKHLMADGAEFIPRDNNAQFHKYPIEHVYPAFVIHRMYRSEIEYISSLLRGNPNSRENIGDLFKDNRHGFKTNSAKLDVIEFPSEAFLSYTKSFSSFIYDYALTDLLKVAQAFVTERANQCIASAKNLVVIDKNLAKKIFSGCKNHQVLKILGVDTESTVYKIDSVSNSEETVEVSGWVTSPHVKTPFYFDIAPNSNRSINYKSISRPDLAGKFPYAPTNCGFKITISLDSKGLAPVNDEKTGFKLFACETKKIKTFHGSTIYFSHHTKKLCQISESNRKDALDKTPVFFTKINDHEALSVLLDGKTFICAINQTYNIELIEEKSLSEAYNLMYKSSVNETDFNIIIGKYFLSAIKDGPIVLDRPTAMAWEVYRLEEEHSSVRKEILDLTPYIFYG